MSGERSVAKSDAAAARPPGARSALARFAARLQDWFVIQRRLVRFGVLLLLVLIPASGIYSFILVRQQALLAEQVAAMASAGEGVWTLKQDLPVVFGAGSLLGFLEANAVDRVSVIYKPLLWDVSERIVLVESHGKQYAYYPSDMETRIFADKAASAPWAGRLVFIPRSELDRRGRELVERLDLRFAGARPQSEKDSWKTLASGLVSALLTIGLLGFVFFQLRGQFKSLKFVEPAQVSGSLDDLVGMDDIKAEVAQIKDQYLRRAEYAEYGVSKPFNVMFSGPAGTGKTRLASYLAKELGLPILFHSAANLETGFVAGGSTTLSRIIALAKRRRRCIIFLDEAQDLFMKRGGRRRYDDDTANTLLSVLDGVRSRSDAELIWIVASNFNSETLAMDEAMLRRFQMKVDFRLPNREERRAIILHYLAQRSAKVLPDPDLEQLVAVTEGRSPADLETIVNQAGISALRAGELISAETLMQAAERVLVGNVNTQTTQERARDRRIIATHEWGHFLVDLDRARRVFADDWERIRAETKTIKISLKANPRTQALGFVFHRQGSNLLQSKADIEDEVRVLLGGMANEELFFGEEGTTNGAHNDISRVTRLLHHAIGELGMFRKTRLNFGALTRAGEGGGEVDDETRSIMEAQSERLYAETRAILAAQMPLTRHLVERLLAAHEMSLHEALDAIRSFEAARASGATPGRGAC